MAVRIMSKTMTQAKRELGERVLGKALGLLGNNPDKNAKYFIRAIDHFIGNDEKRAITRDWIHNWLGEGKPGREWLGKVLKDIHPNVRRRYLARMAVSMFFRDPEINERCLRQYGINSPHVMIVSPTMRCNFRCEGCYAASYERKDDMPPEVLDRILSEAEDLGTAVWLYDSGLVITFYATSSYPHSTWYLYFELQGTEGAYSQVSGGPFDSSHMRWYLDGAWGDKAPEIVEPEWLNATDNFAAA